MSCISQDVLGYIPGYPDISRYVPGYLGPMNDANPMSWDNIFEMRYFSSYVYKESNVQDRRLQDYKTGLDILLEAKKVEAAIFEFEEDIWSK